jgi:hypothetical protein
MHQGLGERKACKVGQITSIKNMRNQELEVAVLAK